MRTDARYDGVSVRCPNASNYRLQARVGCMFLYRKESGEFVIARMLGRVAFAPAIEAGTNSVPEIRNWIHALVLSRECDFAYQTWVNPEEVVNIFETTPHHFVRWFFQPDFPYPVEMLCRLEAHGTLSERYIDKAPERVKQWQREKRRAAQAKRSPA